MKKLTNSQNSIWITEKFYKGTSINNICGSAVINEEVDYMLLEKAIKSICLKYDIFKTRIHIHNNSVMQSFSSKASLEINPIELKNKTELSSILKKIAKQPLDIENGQLFQFYLLKFSNGHGGFIYSIHHLISDAWSASILCNDTIKIYSLLKQNNNFDNQQLYSYIEYLNNEELYENSEKYIKDKEFWQDVFSELPELTNLKGSKSHPKKDISTAKRSLFTIEPNLVNNINNYCKKNKISQYHFFMGIYSLYISEITNLDEFIIGTPILNRNNYKEKLIPGMFVNVLPLKINMSNIEDFPTLTKNILLNTKKIIRHQKYPYQNILEDLRKTNKSIPNLFNILLSYQITNNQNSQSDINYTTQWEFNGHCAENLDIQIFDLNKTSELNISYDYRTNIYTEEDINNLHNRILYIIEQILNNYTIKIKDIDIITPEEKNLILNEFNNTKLKYNKSKKIIRMFESQASRIPYKTALICNNEKITYAHLNEQANILARNLLKQTIKPNSIIGVMMNRSIEMIVAIIAILKCGCAYLPIDPEYPNERINYILENSKSKFVLVNGTTQKNNFNKCKEIDINHIENEITKNIRLNIPDNPLLYLIYTSGSTGKPKGVQITNNNLHNFIKGMNKSIDFNENKIALSITTICFDIFGLELWCSLTSGLTLVIANEQEQNMPSLLNKLCLENNVNIIQTTPSRYSNIFDDRKSLKFFENITDLLVGGEPITKNLLSKLLDNTNANIYNMYGPTETTIWSTIKKLVDENEITVGKPIANTQCYILNKNKKILPINNIGELYIGGDGVSKGYYNREDLTNEKFILSPIDNQSIIYNTNDLAYYNLNGEIVHIGRNDSQIKLHGYRIELEEIQNVIENYSEIKRAIVIQHESKQYLLCYYTSKNEIDLSELNEYILKFLPNYMIPSYFMKLDNIPLTPNGKIDKKQLPDIKSNTTIQYASTATEKLLSSVLTEIIHIENIDINQAFLSYGLDSLGLIQFQTSLLKYNLNLTTQSFYIYQTIKSLAEYIDSSKDYSTESDYKIPTRFKHTENELIISDNIHNNTLGNVFLTGASGFLGIHILDELLNTTTSKIYCLIRGNNQEVTTNKLANCYKFYFKKSIKPYLGNRIFIFNGDLLEEQFGLSSYKLMKISSNVQTIIHTAAIVKHYGDSEQFKSSNVDVTQKIADFAFKNEKRFIHISSVSVSGNYLVKQNNKNVDFSENDLYVGQHYTTNVYVNSKFNAEKIVYNYMSKGLRAEVLRIGILSGRYSDGVFQKNINENAFYSRIKSIIDLKNISSNMLEQKIEFTPVDLCAKAIILLAQNSTAENKVYHLFNHKCITVKDIIHTFKNEGFPVNILPEKDFQKYLLDLSSNEDNQSIFKGIINDLSLNSSSSLDYDFSINILSNYTQHTLTKLGFEWKKIDDKYIKRIIKYMKKVKFLE